jgi:hypothetical protein
MPSIAMRTLDILSNNEFIDEGLVNKESRVSLTHRRELSH